LSNLLGRKISGSEWGRIGRMIKQYDSHSIQEALKFFEEGGSEEYSRCNINVFQKVVSLIDSGNYPSKEEVFEARDKLIEDQNRGKRLIEGLLGGK